LEGGIVVRGVVLTVCETVNDVDLVKLNVDELLVDQLCVNVGVYDGSEVDDIVYAGEVLILFEPLTVTE